DSRTVEQDWDHWDVALKRCRDLDTHEIVRVIKATVPVRIRRVEPIRSNHREQHAALSDFAAISDPSGGKRLLSVSGQTETARLPPDRGARFQASPAADRPGGRGAPGRALPARERGGRHDLYPPRARARYPPRARARRTQMAFGRQVAATRL